MKSSLHVTSGSMVVVLDGAHTHLIPSSDFRYAEILKALAGGIDDKKLSDVINFNDDSDKDDRIEIKPKENKILIDKVEMPESLQKRFMDLKRRHKPRSYLLNFWDKLQKNPNPESIKMLYTFLEHNGHPIMSDGCFIAYKAVRVDMYDHHSRTNLHKIGRVVKMDREKVNSNPRETCSTGLHIAAWEYLKEFHNGESRILEVIVNPKDVVAVPNDYNGSKCRTCAYKVYREVKNPRQENDRTSTAKAVKLQG